MISKQVLLKTVYFYIIPYMVLLMAMLGFMYLYPKPELHLLLNSHHSSCAGPAAPVVEEDQDHHLLCHV